MHAVYDKTLSRKQCRKLWLELLTQYCSSGLSKKDFAKNNEIDVGDLKRWEYRYGEKSKKPKFSALKVIAPVVQNPSPIILKIGNRFCIELAGDFDAAALTRILTVIEPRTC